MSFYHLHATNSNLLKLKKVFKACFVKIFNAEQKQWFFLENNWLFLCWSKINRLFFKKTTDCFYLIVQVSLYNLARCRFSRDFWHFLSLWNNSKFTWEFFGKKPSRSERLIKIGSRSPLSLILEWIFASIWLGGAFCC